MNEDLRGSLKTRETHDLQGSGPAEDARGEVVEVEVGRTVLMAENLPPPEGEIYAPWLMRGAIAEPAGLLEPGDRRDAPVPIEGPIDEADAVAVTLEPSGGSPVPTSDILLPTSL